MAKYVYPAVFTAEKEGYSISFPDIEGCFTQGDSLSEGIDIAVDVLSLVLTDMEDDHVDIPSASDIKSVSISCINRRPMYC